MVFPCSLNTEPTKNPYARRGVDNVVWNLERIKPACFLQAKNTEKL